MASSSSCYSHAKEAFVDLSSKGYRPLLRHLPDHCFRDVHWTYKRPARAKIEFNGDARGHGWELGRTDQSPEWLQIHIGDVNVSDFSFHKALFCAGSASRASCVARVRIQAAHVDDRRRHNWNMGTTQEAEMELSPAKERPGDEGALWRVFDLPNEFRGNAIRISVETSCECALKIEVFYKPTVPSCYLSALQASDDLCWKGCRAVIRDLPDASFRASSRYESGYHFDGPRAKIIPKEGQIHCDGTGWEWEWSYQAPHWLQVSLGRVVQVSALLFGAGAHLHVRAHAVPRVKFQMATLVPGQEWDRERVVDEAEIEIYSSEERPYEEGTCWRVFDLPRVFRGNEVRMLVERDCTCALKFELFERPTDGMLSSNDASEKPTGAIGAILSARHASGLTDERPTYKPLRDFVRDFVRRKTCSEYLLQDARPAFCRLQPGSERWLQKVCDEAAMVTQSKLGAGVQAPGDDPAHAFAIVCYTLDMDQFGAAKGENFFAVYNKILQERNSELLEMVAGYSHFFLGGLHALPPLPEQTLYRGLPTDLLPLIMKHYETGVQIHWSGITSTSTSREVALKFAGSKGILMAITAISARSIQDLSVFGELEREALLLPNWNGFVARGPTEGADGLWTVDIVEIRHKAKYVF
ncbi:unnamed protein product [Symbiodinium natans]|uniref:Mono(ADP-ribosyl)transferase n=1 Tax=Symbiodinium natans TaxID=878477 RepID=A0A812QEY7_9DINO|nr:unnamed protein product [Symbiodinium natans]